MAKVECRVTRPIWHLGKQIELTDDAPAPVISLESSEAMYLQSLGRVQIIDADAEAEAEAAAKAQAEAEAKPAAHKHAKAK